MIPMLLAVFSASLLGSLHCAGMCGPLCGLAVSGGRSPHNVALLHAAYHGGRLVSYAVIGAAAGAAGALLDLASTLAGLQPIAIGLAGGMLVLFGVAELARLGDWNTKLKWFGHWRPPRSWTLMIQRGQRFAARQPATPRALVIGLLTALLPCGWLYAFVVTASAAGAATTGALVMAVFWAGTLPVMLSLGVGVRRLAGSLGARLPLVTALALIAVGVFTITGRASLSAAELAEAVSTAPSADSAAVPDASETPACCRVAEGAEP